VALLDRENCIARLHVLAEKLSGQSQGDVPGVLAQALGTAPETVEFSYRLVALVELGDRARQQVDELVDDPNYDSYAETIDKMVNTFECDQNLWTAG
jgi:hypothetical protein